MKGITFLLMDPNLQPDSQPLGAPMPEHVPSPIPSVLPPDESGNAVSGLFKTLFKLVGGVGGVIFFVIFLVSRSGDDSTNYMVAVQPNGAAAEAKVSISGSESRYIEAMNSLMERNNAAFERGYELVDVPNIDSLRTSDPTWRADVSAQLKVFDDVLAEAKQLTPPARFAHYHVHMMGMYTYGRDAGQEMRAFLADGNDRHLRNFNRLQAKSDAEDAAAKASWNDIVYERTPAAGDSAGAQATVPVPTQPESAEGYPVVLSFVETNRNPIFGACVSIFFENGAPWQSVCDNFPPDLDPRAGVIETSIPEVGGYVHESAPPDGCQLIASDVQLTWAQGVGWEELVHDC
jgi:hypothetical protein